MKKLLLISTILGMLPVMVQATEPVCDTFDDAWCVRHGYTENYTTAVCLSGYTCIKCPFNQGLVFSHVSQVKNCAVGDILWSDNKCYILDTTNNTINNAPSGKQPIGVVFDDVNKLAVALNAESGSFAWQVPQDSSEDHRMEYFENQQTTPKHLFFGQQKRSILSPHDYNECNDGSLYDNVAVYCRASCENDDSACYDAQNDSYDCVDGAGEDCGECNRYLSCPGGGASPSMFCRRTKGCNIIGMITPVNIGFSSTSGLSGHSGIQASSTASLSTGIGLLYAINGYVSSSSQIGGWHDTVRLRAGTLIEKGFNAPAAMTCYNLNTNFSSCPAGRNCMNDTGGAVGAGHVWFLPSVGDLIRLVRNYGVVNSAIGLISEANLSMSEGDYYWSSSQSEMDGFYSYAYAVRNSVDNSGCSPIYSPDVQAGGIRDSAQKVVCVYHYGDDWDMSSYSSLSTTQTSQQQNIEGPAVNTDFFSGNRPPLF